MSSLRNSIQRRPHRERAQPLERRRLGLLEKHKDYSLRAKDYNKKKAQLKALREKAADRNEDEFYFGMMSRKGPGSRLKNGRNWSGTVEGDRGNRSLDVDAVRLLKTQDLGYVRTMKQVAAKERARLEEQVVLTRGLDRLDEEEGDDDDMGNDEDEDDEEGGLSVPAKRKAPRKIVFLDDEAEREEVLQAQTKQDHDDDVEEKKGGKFGGGGGDNDDGEGKQGGNEAFEREKSVRRLKRQLEHARKKVKTLTDAERELEVQRAKMAKTATSGGHTRRGKKIMVRRRKR